MYTKQAAAAAVTILVQTLYQSFLTATI